MLSLIRWSDISVDYIKTELLQNKTLMCDQDCVTFLTKVLEYLSSGVQFEGLRTFHRRSVNRERCMVVVGLDNEPTTIFIDVYQISLQRPCSMSRINKLPMSMPNQLGGMKQFGACIFNEKLYITGIGDKCNKTYFLKLSSLFGIWFRCRDMITGRVRHSSAIAGAKLCVGW